MLFVIERSLISRHDISCSLVGRCPIQAAGARARLSVSLNQTVS